MYLNPNVLYRYNREHHREQHFWTSGINAMCDFQKFFAEKIGKKFALLYSLNCEFMYVMKNNDLKIVFHVKRQFLPPNGRKSPKIAIITLSKI